MFVRHAHFTCIVPGGYIHSSCAYNAVRCGWQQMRRSSAPPQQPRQTQTCRCVSAAAAAIAAVAAGSRTGLPPSSSRRIVARGERGGDPKADCGLSGAGGTSTLRRGGCGAAPGLLEVAPPGGCCTFSSLNRERPLLLLDGDEGSDAGPGPGPSTDCCCYCWAAIASEAASVIEATPCAAEQLALGGSGGGRHWRSKTKASSAHCSRDTGAFRLRSSYSSTVPPALRWTVRSAETYKRSFDGM